jgi:hypothetical protein
MTCGCFQNIKYALKTKECDDGTESYSTRGVPKIFATMAGSIVGSSA